MQTIKVKNCYECRLVEANVETEEPVDNDNVLCCNHPDIIGRMVIESQFRNDTLHPDCPLRKESLTIELEVS